MPIVQCIATAVVLASSSSSLIIQPRQTDCAAQCRIATSTASGNFCSNFDWITAFNACLACAKSAGVDDTFEDAIGRLGLACGHEVQFFEPGDDGDDGSVTALPVPERPMSSEVVQIETQTVTAAPAPSATGVDSDLTSARAQSSPALEPATSNTRTTNQAVSIETNSPGDGPTNVESPPSATSAPQPDATSTSDSQPALPNGSSGPKIDAIVGGVVGVVVGLALIAGVVVCFDRRRKKLKARRLEYTEPKVPEMQRFLSVEIDGADEVRPEERHAVAKNF